MTNITFNTKKLIQYKNSSFRNWHKHNFIFEKFAEHFYIKISEIKNQFERILLLTSDFDETINQVRKLESEAVILQSPFKVFLNGIPDNKKITKVLRSFEKIEYDSESFDLVINNFCLGNINNIDDHLKKIIKLLKKDGLLICNFFGGETLNELRNSLIITDNKIFNGAFIRLTPNLKMVEIVDLMNRVGFKEIVSEVINYQVFYKKLNNLLNDIRGVGENTILNNVNKGLKTKNYFDTLSKVYFENYSINNKIVSTCDVVSITCWK